MNALIDSRQHAWPSLPLDEWRETCAALHLWTQIVGKIRLSLSPWVNHSWHTTLYVTATGLTTSVMPYGSRSFQIDFNFLEHQLWLRSSDGRSATLVLEPQSVASFYGRLMEQMHKLDIGVRINRKPNEIADSIPFYQDVRVRPYDADYAGWFWRILQETDRVFAIFRAHLQGKCSPVHFFLGRRRSCGYAIFRPKSSSAPRRRAEPARLGHPRGLLARSQ